MTEIQQTNVQVANHIIDELHKDKPFDLKLSLNEYKAFLRIYKQTDNGVGFISYEKGGYVYVGINKLNADQIYHMLSSYIAKFDQYGVVRALGEVS